MAAIKKQETKARKQAKAEVAIQETSPEIDLEKKRMSYLFLLSGENPDFAKEEVLAIAINPDHRSDENVMVVETAINFKRLALTRKVYEFLFSCSRKDIEKEMAQFDWSSVYRENFCFRAHRANKKVPKLGKSEKELAAHIWNALKEPKVDLRYPRTRIEMILTTKNAYFGKLLEEKDEAFSKRRSHLRPQSHPTSLDPKLARACVNLSGIKTGDLLVDPFCGAGGIMLEAGLMRFATKGYDVDEEMLKKCEQNLDYYKVKRFHLEQRDATRISESADYVVTDLPYGKGSAMTEKRDVLYLNFLKNLENILKSKAVIIFPSFVDHKSIIKQMKFRIEKEFSVYIHRSMTRNIVLLSKKN
ncbi:MAG: methyltransferase domain-containing protein [Nanoarchaeota archaeon]|nr:methyltransferase domain-containing protein [Nanoarchaeota archaeon]